MKCTNKAETENSRVQFCANLARLSPSQFLARCGLFRNKKLVYVWLVCPVEPCRVHSVLWTWQHMVPVAWLQLLQQLQLLDLA